MSIVAAPSEKNLRGEAEVAVAHFPGPPRAQSPATAGQQERAAGWQGVFSVALFLGLPPTHTYERVNFFSKFPQ